MKIKSKLLCAIYGLLALTAAILIPFQNVYYISYDFIQANINFWSDAIVNPAARSVTIDIVVMYFTACVVIFVEGRKFRIKFFWVYIVMGYLFAIAVTFPIFLLHREIKLSKFGKV